MRARFKSEQIGTAWLCFGSLVSLTAPFSSSRPECSSASVHQQDDHSLGVLLQQPKQCHTSRGGLIAGVTVGAILLLAVAITVLGVYLYRTHRWNRLWRDKNTSYSLCKTHFPWHLGCCLLLVSEIRINLLVCLINNLYVRKNKKDVFFWFHALTKSSVKV